MLWDRPKSSALTTNRRRFSACAIVWDHRSRKQAVPSPANKQDFLAGTQAGRIRAEYVETKRLQFAEQTPVDATHQFGRRHRPKVLRGQSFLGLLIKLPSVLGNAGSEISK